MRQGLRYIFRARTGTPTLSANMLCKSTTYESYVGLAHIKAHIKKASSSHCWRLFLCAIRTLCATFIAKRWDYALIGRPFT